jgi:hypothetical protein
MITAATVLSGAMFVSGCKSAPELTAAQAQTLIQGKYDQDAATGATIMVFDQGMQQGVSAKYWDRSKAYPNKYWADFKLTADGKKVLKLPSGTDVIEWRPESLDDKNFSIPIVTAAANHLKARGVQDPQDEMGGTRTATYTEVVSLDGVPAPLQDMARDPGNQLSKKKTASFTLEGGAWKLGSIN